MNSRSARVTPCEAMRVGATPKCQGVLSGAGPQTCSGRGVRKAERRSAAGRRNGPEAVTGQETEWNRGDSHLSAISLCFGTMPSTGKPDPSSSPDLRTKSRISHPVSLVFCSARSCSKAHNRGEILFAPHCPGRLFIGVSPIHVSIRSITPQPHRRRDKFPPSRRTAPRGYSRTPE